MSNDSFKIDHQPPASGSAHPIEQFQRLTEQSPLSVQIMAPDGRTLWVNPAWEKLWGATFADLDNYNIFQDQQLIDKGVMPYIKRGFAGTATHIPAIDYNPAETKELTDGTNLPDRWIRAYIYPGKDPAGNISEIILTHEDVTEQRRISKNLHDRESRLVEAQRVSKIGSWELDLTNDQLFWTNEIYQIFEIDRKKFGASYEAFLNAIHPDDRELVNTAYTESLKTKKPYTINHRLLMKDGRIKHVQEHCKSEYNKEGNPVRSIGTVQDITDRILAEKDLREHYDHLEDLVNQRTEELRMINQELESFSYSVSHDLRAPLRHIDGFSQVLQEDYTDKLDEDGQTLLRRIRAGSQHMGQLIDDLLKLSQVSRGNIERELLNLSSMAEDIFNKLQHYNTERKISIDIKPKLIASADHRLLHVLLENLIGNAWKYTSKTDNASITFDADTDRNGETIFCLRDNGAGFDMKHAEKLFTAFKRLHTEREFEGTGIGLATVQRIINRHHGRIWAESETGKGAAFYFSLGR